MAEMKPDSMTLLDKMSSEVTPATSPLLELLTNNAKLIVIVLAACFVVAGGYGFYAWNMSKKVLAAQEGLARTLVLEDSQDKLAKLKAFIPGAPESMRPGLAFSLARTAMKIKDYSVASEAWDSLAQDSKDPVYAVAVIGKAESLSLLGKSTEALAVLENMTLPAESVATSMVNVLIVDLAEQTGNYDKGIAACEKLISNMTARSPEEAEYWRQRAVSLRVAAKS